MLKLTIFLVSKRTTFIQYILKAQIAYTNGACRAPGSTYIFVDISFHMFSPKQSVQGEPYPCRLSLGPILDFVKRIRLQSLS